MNNAQYALYFAANMSLFRNFRVAVHETIIDEEARKVVMFASSSADTELGNYANEYVIQVEIGQNEREAERVIKWVESGYSTHFLGKLKKEAERMKGKGEETRDGQPKV